MRLFDNLSWFGLFRQEVAIFRFDYALPSIVRRFSEAEAVRLIRTLLSRLVEEYVNILVYGRLNPCHFGVVAHEPDVLSPNVGVKVAVCC